jgi:hypothetical protein
VKVMGILTALRFGVALVQVGGELLVAGVRSWRGVKAAGEDEPTKTNLSKLRGEASGSAGNSEANNAGKGKPRS